MLKAIIYVFLIIPCLVIQEPRSLDGNSYLWIKNTDVSSRYDKSIMTFTNDSVFIYDLPLHPSGFIYYYPAKYTVNSETQIIRVLSDKQYQDCGNTGSMNIQHIDNDFEFLLVGENIKRKLHSGLGTLEKEGEIQSIYLNIHYSKVDEIESILDETWQNRIRRIKGRISHESLLQVRRQ